ncbi:glycosyltransferase [Empedobacter falsenii]
MSKIVIIIPCYNEEVRLNIDYIKQIVTDTDLQIYFANDGSTDNTFSLIESICKQLPNCFYINFSQNEGKAMTIYKSIKLLTARNEFDYIGYFDADFSTPPNQLINIVEYLKNNDVGFVFASRIKKLNSKIIRKTYRHFIGRSILTIINFKHKLGIYDTQCGCKIFSKEIIDIGFKDTFKTTWLFDVEVFIRLKKSKLLAKGIEYPIEEWRDIEGSKLKLNHFAKIFKEIITLYTKYN